MVNRKDTEKGVLQDRVIWEAEDRAIVKELLQDSYRLRMDVKGVVASGAKKIVLQEYFSPEEQKYLTYLLKLTQDLDREIATYVEDRLDKYREKLSVAS
jgi:hypothetical protein